MYSRLVLFALFTVQWAVGFSQADSAFHIYLMFGQSNMEGQGIIEAQDRVTNPRVKMLQDSTCPNLNRVYGSWYTAAPPLNRCWGRLGPGDSFGRMLGEKAPSYVKTIGLVNVSVSGCNIYIYKKGCPDGLDQYSKGIPFNCGYTWLLDLAKKAQQVGVIKGIIFHQGETNTSDPNWKFTIQQIVADLKADLGLGDIPFLAGELLYAKYNSCCSAHNVEINKLPSLIPNAHVISAAELPGADAAHFTSASYRTLGERYAQKMLKLVYGICDSTTIESWCQVNGGEWTLLSDIKVLRGSSLVLSPRPSNSLGKWSWTGAGTFGAFRVQTINTETIGVDTALATFTNDCGAKSHLQVRISVCDSSSLESWYQIDGGSMARSDTIYVNQNAVLKLSPESADEGTWNWTGAGTSGSSREQTVNTTTGGVFIARAAFTNSCGITSHLPVKITVNPFSGILWNNAVNNSVRIYPNPAINTITFDRYSGSGSPQIKSGTIANMFGQTVLTLSYTSLNADNYIDISSLSAGTYYLKLVNDKGIAVNKFVKLK
jgi:hypothetical protein